MANRTAFVDLGDTHAPLASGDSLTNADGVKYVLQGDPTGILSAHATLAAAILAAPHVLGQFALIDGGDSASTGFPNADKGVWKVTSNDGSSLGDYTKVMDGTDKASEVSILDSANFFAGTTVEAALAEVGTKQVFYKLGHTTLNGITCSGTTSTAANSAIAALVLDDGSMTDGSGVGTATVNGVVLNGTYPHQIPLRKNGNRDVIDDGSGNEVYARLTHNGTAYVLSFYSWQSGSEVAYNLSSQSIDLGFVLVSMDLMKLPAHAGVTDGTFFGDDAGVVGTVDDSQVVTNSPAFTGLLVGMSTQEAVNNKVDELSLTGNGQGASLIGVEDADGYLAATNVEAALAELWVKANGRVRHYDDIANAVTAAGTTPFAPGEYVIIKGVSVPADRGIHVINASSDGSNSSHYTKVLDISHTAAEVLVADAGSNFTTDTVEAALAEIMTAIGGTNSTTRDYSSNVYVADNDSLVVAIGKLDAAIGALSSNKLVVKTLVADGAIDASTDSPRLVGFGTAANDVSLLDAGQSTIKEVVGFATGADYADNATISSGDGVVITGLVTGFTGLTAGAAYYADPANPGDITTTVTSTIGEWIVPVGVALNTTTLLCRIGEPSQVVAAEKTLQRGVHYRSTDDDATGLNETGYTVEVGDLWIDDDTTVQNPTKSGTGKRTVYVCTVAWTGAGDGQMSEADITGSFVAVGTQN